ncbi:hypothetical protein SAMD00019534_079600, partial [Acytostelium subglobosum LB1]|uniref:hypothetical protein n=1 Tax=Acytostelium subglobosum LB1 TaxID=1410327 RepID=UPI0006449258
IDRYRIYRMGSLAVVQQLHTLSLDPDHREFIVKDQGCLPALVMFLSSTEEAVVSTTLDTLGLLAQNDNNRPLMLKEPGLMSGLKKLATTSTDDNDTTTNNNTIRTQSSAIVAQLEPQTPPTSSTTFHAAPAPVKLQTSFSMLVGDKFAGGSQHRVPNGAASNAKTLIFFIKGMNTEALKKQVEECLLKTKGIISFMIDLHTYQATIRCTIGSDEIKAAIRYTLGLQASLMIDGQEEVDNSPDYLPEINGGNTNSSKKSNWSWNSIVSFGTSTDNAKPANQNWGWGSISKALFG